MPIAACVARFSRTAAACLRGKPADKEGAPEDEKLDARPDEKPAPPPFRPSEQDPFYLGLCRDLRKARRDARKKTDSARRRQRWATDADFRDRHRAGRYGLSLQDYRAMRERQGNVCAICRAPGKPLCVDHCHATDKVRGLLCRDCNLGLGNYKDNPVFTRAATAYLEAARRDDGNQRRIWEEGAIRFHDLVFGARLLRTRTEAWTLRIRRLFSRILCPWGSDSEARRHSRDDGGKSQGNLQENTGPTTCPLQACRPNCR
jgi:hypothetical protein